MALHLSVLPKTTLSSPHFSSENRSILSKNNPNRNNILLLQSQNALTSIRKRATQKAAYISNNTPPPYQKLGSTHAEKSLKREDFPEDFIFGIGSSALQIEGSGTEGGRGPSTWDALIRADKGGKGVDSYNMYKEDVKMLAAMGVDCYRFSISWPRILPTGDKNNVNKEGIAYYNALLDELEANNIKPMATLFHFDMPSALEEKYHGFSDRRIINDFKDYCDTCFEHFGNRIKHWITINESATFVLYGPYLLGTNDTIDPSIQYLQTHNMILAHAAAAHSYHTNYQAKQGGEIGVALTGKWCEPLDPENPGDQDCVTKAFERFMGWYMGPLCKGDYPPELKDFVVNIPKFTEEEKKLLAGSCDFVGVNYYTCSYATHGFDFSPNMAGHIKKEFISETYTKDGVYIGPVTDGLGPTYVYPEGLRKMLIYIKDHYNNPKVYITENGVPGKPTISLSVKDAIAVGKEEMINIEMNDDYRIDAIYGHIKAVHDARKDGANVQGYFVWSLLDNNELGQYDIRFGMTYMDYLDNYKRYPKKSAKWYGKFLNKTDSDSNSNSNSNSSHKKKSQIGMGVL